MLQAWRPVQVRAGTGCVRALALRGMACVWHTGAHSALLACPRAQGKVQAGNHPAARTCHCAAQDLLPAAPCTHNTHALARPPAPAAAPAPAAQLRRSSGRVSTRAGSGSSSSDDADGPAGLRPPAWVAPRRSLQRLSTTVASVGQGVASLFQGSSPGALGLPGLPGLPIVKGREKERETYTWLDDESYPALAPPAPPAPALPGAALPGGGGEAAAPPTLGAFEFAAAAFASAPATRGAWGSARWAEGGGGGGGSARLGRRRSNEQKSGGDEGAGGGGARPGRRRSNERRSGGDEGAGGGSVTPAPAAPATGQELPSAFDRGFEPSGTAGSVGGAAAPAAPATGQQLPSEPLGAAGPEGGTAAGAAGLPQGAASPPPPPPSLWGGAPASLTTFSRLRRMGSSGDVEALATLTPPPALMRINTRASTGSSCDGTFAAGQRFALPGGTAEEVRGGGGTCTHTTCACCFCLCALP